MNLSSLPPEHLVLDLLERSPCAVQVAAVLADAHGIFAWGWNHSGSSGMGIHAEAHALSRANSRRLERATIYVASQRKKNKSPVMSRPCKECWDLLKANGVPHVVYRDKSGDWPEEKIR